MIKRLATFSALAAAVVVAACTVHQSDSAPPLTGPSDFAQSISITSNPDRLTQDGQSESAIVIKVYDATGSAAVGVPVRLDMLVFGTLVDFGTLSTKNVVTLSDGKATVVYRAPPAPPPGSSDTTTTVTIRAIASGTNAQSSNPFSTDIRLVPPGVILPPAGTPTASFTMSPTPASANVPLIFDASASLPGTNATIDSYQWNFGDGSSASGRTVTKTFTAAGTYNVTLTVTNNRGLAASTSQVVSVGTTAAPTAAFTFSPASPGINQVVNFNASASIAAPGRTISSYSWNFGDGSATKSGVTAQHDFGVAGTYTVTLTVTDDVGQRSTAQQSVTVASVAGGLFATFTFSPTNPIPGTIVNFNASSSTGPIVRYDWDFGDGFADPNRTTPTTTHAFSSPAAYVVRLTVFDAAGRSNATTQTVTVQVPAAPPTPTPPVANFDPSPLPARAGTPVNFTSTSTTPSGAAIRSYTWSFGDLTSCPASCGAGVSPFSTVSHTYPLVGVSGTVITYSVTLTITDANNLSSTKTVSLPVTTP